MILEVILIYFGKKFTGKIDFSQNKPINCALLVDYYELTLVETTIGESGSLPVICELMASDDIGEIADFLMENPLYSTPLQMVTS